MTARVARTAYQRRATAKVIEIETKVEILCAKLGLPKIGDCTGDCGILRKSMHQAQCCMRTVQAKLHELYAADDANWDSVRKEFDNAWEDVTQSIKNVMVRTL